MKKSKQKLKKILISQDMSLRRSLRYNSIFISSFTNNDFVFEKKKIHS